MKPWTRCGPRHTLGSHRHRITGTGRYPGLVPGCTARTGTSRGNLEVGLRDLACTILLAIVGADAAVFAQLGDGAIITGEGDHYTPVFWPPAGEYANVTDFLTDADFAER